MDTFKHAWQTLPRAVRVSALTLLPFVLFFVLSHPGLIADLTHLLQSFPLILVFPARTHAPSPQDIHDQTQKVHP